MRRPSLLLPILCALAVSCGSISSPDDDDDDDDVVADAAVSSSDADPNAPDAAGGSTDAAPNHPDAPPPRTPCGKESCERATEICVISSGPGPSGRPTCAPLPEGCEDDRSCECVADKVCSDIADVCFESDEDNTVICECSLCG